MSYPEEDKEKAEDQSSLREGQLLIDGEGKHLHPPLPHTHHYIQC